MEGETQPPCNLYKYRHLHWNNNQLGVITNKWYQSAAITPTCCQSAHSSALSSVCRLHALVHAGCSNAPLSPIHPLLDVIIPVSGLPVDYSLDVPCNVFAATSQFKLRAVISTNWWSLIGKSFSAKPCVFS